MIVTGHSIQVTVRSGCLVITSGRETTRIERAPKVHERLVLAGNIGLITIEAMVWLQEYGLAWSVLWRDSGLIGGSHDGKGDPGVWRRQVTADPLPVTRFLLAAKLRGHAANAEMLRNADAAKRINGYAERLMLRGDLAAMTGQEGRAASVYWQVWRDQVTVPWVADHMLRVPPRWIRFNGRESVAISASNRRASDPVNALLNYAYRVGESLCVEACYEAGLSPVLGVGHDRKHVRSRDGERPKNSMALDLLETIRPACDRVVLELLDYGQGIRPYLEYRDFLELDSGIVRVESKSLRESVIMGCEESRHEISGYAKEIVRILS